MRSARLAIALGLLLLAGAAWADAPFRPMQDPRFSLAVYLLTSFIVFVDSFDIALRLHRRRVQSKPADPRDAAHTSVPLDVGRFNPYQRKLHLRPYALAISVHDLGDELDTFVAAMEPHRDHVYVIDDASNDATAERLAEAGIRVIRGERNRHKPGAIRELLRHLPNDVETVLVMDPDCRVLERVTSDISTLENVIFDFQRSRHAALCPHLTIERDGWLTCFQRLEYALAFGVGRKSLGDHSITSGIAIYRRESLDAVLREHSLSVYAEDLENTLHLLARRESIYYDERLVIETEGKKTLGSWFSQRVGWSFGLAKVYTQNAGPVWRASRGNPMRFYHFLVYLGVFSLLFHPLKLAGALPLFASAANLADTLLGWGLVPDTAWSNPWYFPLVYAQYTVLIGVALVMAAPKGRRLEHAPFVLGYLPYQIAHLLPVTVGFLNWISLRVAGRRLYRDHFADDAHVHG
jgi:cellulose synthase/poly-beta-1,6-N-acetylglucosamine synthase-like glycosyltransferase